MPNFWEENSVALEEPKEQYKGDKFWETGSEMLDEQTVGGGLELPDDPDEQEKMLRDVLDTAADLEIGINDAEDNYKTLNEKPQRKPLPPGMMGISAAPEPTKWEKFKRFFVSDRPPLPPNADRMEKITRAFDLAASGPLRAFFKFSKGRTLGAPDLMWAAIKRITPDDMWVDEVKNMTLDEAMDWAGGYNPSGFQKSVGEIAEFVGRLNTVAPIAQKIGVIGNTPKDISTLVKAQEAAKLFGLAAATEQAGKIAFEKIDPSQAEYGYEGPKAVLRDMAIGAAFSIAHSGIKGVWKMITPSEEARVLKVLGLKKGASLEEIENAAKELSREFQPGTIETLRNEFANAVKERVKFIREGEVIFRGQKVKFTPKMLEGETAKQYAIRTAKAERGMAEDQAQAERHMRAIGKEAKSAEGAESQISDLKSQKAAEKKTAETLKDTKLVDEKGKPLVVYHGTTRSFEKFNKNLAGTGQGTPGEIGIGIYFTPDPEVAASYAESPEGLEHPEEFFEGQNIRPVYLNIKKPVIAEKGIIPDEVINELKHGKQDIDTYLARVVPETKEENIALGINPELIGIKLEKEIAKLDVAPFGYWVSPKIATIFRDELINQGYDGIILTYDGKIDQIVVFESEQVIPKYSVLPEQGKSQISDLKSQMGEGKALDLGVPERTLSDAIRDAQKRGKNIYIRHDAGKGEKSRGWYTRTTPPKSGDFFTVTPDGEVVFGFAPKETKPSQISDLKSQMAEPPKGGARMMSGFDPGIDMFIAEDVVPAVESAIEAVKAAGGVVKAIGHMAMDILEPARAAKKKAGTEAYVKTIKAIHKATDVARLEFEQQRLEAIDMNVAELRKWFGKFTKEQQKDFVIAFAGQPGTPDAMLMQKQAFDRLPAALQDTKVIKAVREISERNYKDLKKVADGKVGYVEDYFYGVFKNPEEVARFIDYWRSTEKFLKHKNVPSVADAILYALEAGRTIELRQGNYIDNLMAERLGIARLGAMRWLRDELITTGKGVLIENMAESPIDFQAVHDPVFDGYRVMPDLANLVNKLISTNKVSQVPALNAIRKMNNFIRIVKFYGSMFHQRVIIKAAMADSGFLGFLHKKSAYKWLTPASQHSWDKVKQQPEYKRLLELGLGYRYSLEEQAIESFDDFVEKLNSGNYLGVTFRIPGLFLKIPKGYARWMFEQWIPMVKYQKVIDAWVELEKKTGRQATDAELIDIIKEQQNFYGEMNERLFGRSGTATSVLRFFFQAPGFAEGNYRTNIKSLIEWGIFGQEHSASRSRANIFNSLLITSMAATAGTLIITGKPPKKPETVDDFKDLWKIDTGKKDARGRRVMIDLLDYDKDYFNLYFNLFRGRPDEAVLASIKRIGGMKAPIFDVANDIASVAMGKALYDWKGDRVVQITDPWIEKLLKISAYEAQKFEPISVSVFKQSQEKQSDKIWSFVESVSGVKPTVSEKDKREGQILRLCWSLKGQQEETYISLAEIERPREAVEWYNNRVKDVLEGPLVEPETREKWMKELTIDLDKYLENKAQEASMLSTSEDTQRKIDRAVKVLKNFGITAEEAVRLREQREQRLYFEGLEGKYEKDLAIMIQERLERNDALKRVMRSQRIEERMKD